MKADIYKNVESQIHCLNTAKMFSSDLGTYNEIQRRIKFLKMVLNAPIHEIDEKVLKFVYGEK